jgi:Heterokaryon incompatibility protein (HET)
MLRRLELLPGTGQIRCKLENVSLSDKPIYEAISDHWGGTAEKHQIVCNSASLTITDSLHSALVRFRTPEESRHLWADQLCINQADPDERGHQVGFMREIYENATQTLVWLGAEGDDDPHAVFDLLRGLATAQRRRRACTPPDKRTIMNFRPPKPPNTTFQRQRVRSGKSSRSYFCALSSNVCG